MASCDELRPLLTELALGDLDAEPARELRAHLSGCAACRAAEAAAARTLGLLQAALPPSTERRLAAVRAMSEARPRAASRRGWMAAAAAALIAASGSLVWVASRPGMRLQVAEVVGGAYRVRGAEGGPLAAGDWVGPGDQVIAAEGGRVRLEGRGTSIRLEGGAALGLTADGRLMLERGVLEAEAVGGRPLAIHDRVGDVATVRGRASVGLREMRGQVAGSFETQEGGRTPEARQVTTWRLAVKVAAGEVELDGSHRQRLRATSGQEGGFEFDGRPFAK